MKTLLQPQRERAVALIIVLAMLVLLSGLVVSFMTTVGNERAATIVSTNEVTTRQIADSTVNLVISQIREATSQSGLDATVPTTWSSQPGAIRTLSGVVGAQKPITNGAGGVKQWTYQPGSNDFIFKLYSAEKMKITIGDLGGSAWDKKETGVIEKWDRTLPESVREETKSLFGYVDLNEPIVTPMPESLTGGNAQIVEPRYPIVDPRAKSSETEAPNKTENPGIVDGFDMKTTGMDDPNLKFIPKDATGARTAGKTEKVSYLPMPVKWLYVMRDGSMAAADDGGKIAGATADNPIVGRTAFWTDDDSCRLNINTASEGTFWDTPTASSEQESGNVNDSSGALSLLPASLMLGASQPVRGEYQRYPGHPATTSLSPALGWMWKILPTQKSLAPRDKTLLAMKDAITQLAPFSPYGIKGVLPLRPPNSTSAAGSWNADSDYPPASDPSTRPDPQLAITTKHLYATVDELVFKQDRVTPNPTDPTILNSANITPEALEKVRFFLTANSRSPELNLFGRPRVTIWPVSAKESLRTAFDDLFAFTSTLYKDPNGVRKNDNAFYMTRYDAKSYKNDFDASDKTGKGLVQRNVEIMTYLKSLTGKDFPIPSFGGNFADKYTVNERDEILTLIFDYCRCVNLVDTGTRTRAGAFQPYTPFFGAGTSGYVADTTRPGPRSQLWSGQVTPLRTERFDAQLGFQGLGRFPTIKEAALIFYRTGANRPKMGNTQDSIQVALVFDMATPMPGLPAIHETFFTVVTVVRPTNVKIGTGEMQDIELVGPRNTARWNTSGVCSNDVGQGRGFMPMLGWIQQLHYYEEPSGWTDIADASRPKANMSAKATPKIFEKDDSTRVFFDPLDYKRGKAITYYPYISNKIPAPSNTASAAEKLMTIEGGAYDVDIYSGEAPDDPRKQLVQKIHLNFPGNANPTPPLTPEASLKIAIPEGSGDASLAKRFTGGQESPKNFLFQDDVVRSIELVTGRPTSLGNVFTQQPAPEMKGDIRLAMARREVFSDFYQPREGLTVYNGTKRKIFGLHTGHGEPMEGNSVAPVYSRIAKNGLNNGKIPILPLGINGVQNKDGGPGDWDRGLSKHVDGAYGNKVDEGNVYFGYGDSSDGGKVPYFRGRAIEETGRSFFSPNRQLSSPVMFGSLPTGVVRGLPWQTLLFRPDRGKIPHPGAQSSSNPADHLLLDLFSLPVVEPYAISEPFSTGGKVNLNYVIAPFGYAKGDPGKRGTNGMDRSYIRRDTALRGVLKAVRIMAVPTTQSGAAHTEGPVNTTTKFRYEIDAEKTLDQFEDRLKDPARGLFRSASEICDMDLYPTAPKDATDASPAPNPALTDWGTFWDTDFAQTGDNMRERPYSLIYPRVTTKSNIYTIYMRCQAVKKVAGTAVDKFDPKKDKVIGSYRGSATVERFIDPNDTQLANYDPNARDSSVDKFYRFRVLATKQFLPR